MSEHGSGHRRRLAALAAALALHAALLSLLKLPLYAPASGGAAPAAFELVDIVTPPERPPESETSPPPEAKRPATPEIPPTAPSGAEEPEPAAAFVEIAALPLSLPTVPAVSAPADEEETYLPLSQLTRAPELDQRALHSSLVYPSLALKNEIEGVVVVEILIDREGVLREVTVLLEQPKGCGFAEAAVKAFEGLRAKPAEVDGRPAAARYRYPVRFKLTF